jgi:hypothetical protein
MPCEKEQLFAGELKVTDSLNVLLTVFSPIFNAAQTHSNIATRGKIG